jgi:hypothetical protein
MIEREYRRVSIGVSIVSLVSIGQDYTSILIRRYSHLMRREFQLSWNSSGALYPSGKFQENRDTWPL